MKERNTTCILGRRESGCFFNSRNDQSLLKELAEDKVATYHMEETHCKLPSSVRSTFLMTFSSDGSKVASTHGDHKIYVCDVRKGTLLHTLDGHPRTPWCVAFHPSSNDILASGCLGGEVRVWDLHGGSEVWVAEHNTVITSLAFHPLDKVLVIATFNEVHFWDWSHSTPFATCKTASEKEKVRFVKFDSLGTKLITGISNLPADPFRSPVNSQDVSCFPPSRGFFSQRRNILSRLMSMYRHLEGLEEISNFQENRSFSFSPIHDDALIQAREYAQEITVHSNPALSSSQNAEQVQGMHFSDSQPSTSGYQIHSTTTNSNSDNELQSQSRDFPLEEESHSSDFWTAFHRLRTVCFHLERHIQQQQRDQNWVDLPSNDIVAAGSVEAGREEVASRLTSDDARSNYWEETQDVSMSLVSLLTRLQHSLQNLNSAAFTTAIAQEQIQQVHVRISEILERLTNVSGYRARLTNLRDQIYEAAERMVQGGEDSSLAHRWDLAHCLWLVEMSLQLTRQMQRILAADYRLTHLHVSASASSNSLPVQSSFSSYSSESNGSEDSSRSDPDRVNIRDHFSSMYSASNDPIPDNSCDANGAHRIESHNSILNTTTNQSVQAQQNSEASDSFMDIDISCSSQESTQNFSIPINTKVSSSAETLVRDSAFNVSSNELQKSYSGNKLQDSFWRKNKRKTVSRDAASESDISFPSTSGLNSQLAYVCKAEKSSNKTTSSETGRLPPLPHKDSANVSSDSSDENNDRQQGSFRKRQIRRRHLQSDSAASRLNRRRLVIPEVQIEPSPEETALPSVLRERPRSPPLPTILSGSGLPLSTWGRISPYLSLFYDSGFRPRMAPFIGIHESAHHLTHRIQSWDFAKCQMPCIRNAGWNVVVPKCKIHNDASVDISRDGQLLAALIPTTSGLRHAVMLSIYSLHPHTLGQCLYTWKFGPNVISVSLSPLGRYIIVGLASPRLYLSSAERETVAQIFKLEPDNKCNTLLHVRNLSQQGVGQQVQVSLNSVRWLPHPGQGLIYGTNRGCLCICRPSTPLEKEQILPGSPFSAPNHSSGELNQQTSQVPNMLSTSTQTIHPETSTTGTQTAVNTNSVVDTS